MTQRSYEKCRVWSLEYALQVTDPRPNKKTRWFEVLGLDQILKERRPKLERGNEGLIGK